MSFASGLPRLPSDLDVIVVRKESSNQTHCDFRVRRSVVDQALQWLIAHNIYYRAQHVHIDLRRLWLVYHRMGVSLMSVLLH